MIKAIFHDSRKGLKVLIIILAALLLLGAIYKTSISIISKSNEEKVQSVLSTWKEISSQEKQDKFSALLDLPFLSDETKGDIYAALAHNSYTFQNKMIYNNNIGAANYYYNVSGAEEKTVNLLSGYIGRLYENGGFRACISIFERVENQVNVSEMSDKSTSASFYLGYADVEEMLGNTSEANSKLKLAKSLMEKDPNADVINNAKYWMLKARCYLLNGDLSQAERILAKYTLSDTFGLDKKNQSYRVNYILPNYELRAKLLIEKGQYTDAQYYIDKYIDLCKDCNFYSLELRMYDYVLSRSSAEELNNSNYKNENQALMHKMLDFTSNDYCSVLLESLDNVYSIEKDKSDHQRELNDYLYAIYISAFVIAILIYMGYLIHLYQTMDELTRLKNRKLYATRCHYMARHRKMHYVIIFDIDDFKQVNDTFGHNSGDEVLRTVGQIIRNNLGKNDQAFRYGGEELCILALQPDDQSAMALAENIRRKIEEYPWDNHMAITVSGGIACSSLGEYTFEAADTQMYKSKSQGKNRVNGPQ